MTLLLHELAVLPKNSRPEGRVEGSQSVTLLTLLKISWVRMVVRMNGCRRSSKIKEETRPVLLRVLCWRLQRSHTSCQHTCQGPEI